MPDQTLAQRVRAKYPGAYDDLTDQALEAKIKAKYPGVYDDLPTTPPAASAPSMEPSESQIGAFFKNLWASGPVAQTAAIPGQALHPVETAKAALASNQQLFDEAYNAFQRGEYGHAAVKGLYYLLNGIPGLGAGLNEAGNQLNRGEIGAGLGTAVGTGLTLAAPSVAHAKAPEIAAGLTERAARAQAAKAAKAAPAANRTYFESLEKAIGPTAKHPSQDVINKTLAKPHLVAEHAAAPIETVPQVVEAADRAIQTIQGQVERYVDTFKTQRLAIDPKATAKKALEGMRGGRTSDLTRGINEIADLAVVRMPTLRNAFDAIHRLNAENKAVLQRNRYDLATARAQDPAFVAREAVAADLRDAVYGYLEDRGVPDVRHLRREEGALIAVRNAAQKQVFNGEKIVTGAVPQNLPSRFVNKAVRYGTATLGAGAGYTAGGSLGGALGAAGGVVVGEQLANKIAPRLTRNDLVKRAFRGLSGERPAMAPVPEVPTPAVPPAPTAAPMPVQPPVPLAAAPSGGSPLLAGARQRMLPMEAPSGERALVAPRAAAPSGRAIAGDRPVEHPTPRAVGQSPAQGGGGTGPAPGGTRSLPESFREHFHRLVPFARRAGYQGSLDSLAARYADKLDEAREIARSLAPSKDEIATGQDLLRFISKIGGLSIQKERGGGFTGELEDLLEGLNRQTGKIRRGPRAGERLPKAFRRSGGVPGFPGIIKRQGGLSVDHVLEVLHEDPRWAHQFETAADFLEAFRDAVFEAHEGAAAASNPFATPDGIQNILESLLHVEPENRWWEAGPEPSAVSDPSVLDPEIEFPFGENAPPKKD